MLTKKLVAFPVGTGSLVVAPVAHAIYVGETTDCRALVATAGVHGEQTTKSHTLTLRAAGKERKVSYVPSAYTASPSVKYGLAEASSPSLNKAATYGYCNPL